MPLPVLAGGVTEVVHCPFCRDLFIQVDIAELASGESITGRVEGSLDGIGWDNLAASGEDTTISASGTTILSYDGAITPYIRCSGFVTTNAASEATIAVQMYIASMV